MPTNTYIEKFPLHAAVKVKNTTQCIQLLANKKINPFIKDPDKKMPIDLAYDNYMTTYKENDGLLTDDTAFILKLFLDEHCAIGVNWPVALPNAINLDNCLIVGYVLSERKNNAPIFLRTEASKEPQVQKRIQQALSALRTSSQYTHLQTQLHDGLLIKRHTKSELGIIETSQFNSQTIIHLDKECNIPDFLTQLNQLKSRAGYFETLAHLSQTYAPDYCWTSKDSLNFSNNLGKVSKPIAAITLALMIIYDITLLVIALLGRVYREDDHGNIIFDSHGHPITRFDHDDWKRFRLAAFGGNAFLGLVFITFILGILASFLKLAPQQIFLLIDNIKIYFNRQILDKEIILFENQLPAFLIRHYKERLQQDQNDQTLPLVKIENLILAVDYYSEHLIPDPYSTLPKVTAPMQQVNKNSFWSLKSINTHDEETPLVSSASYSEPLTMSVNAST